ncbi:sensor domain-containing diguanylate cyclase [Ramlibacter humi]|uniref:Diguanylate cyclase n=1 Tax=Ramlibacter humi TaxID=2530451 RepID=A0A4Z0BY82_9BURK|nr:7TM diverse intracellular signaling domain-containing protein [Ramlibacter humi]TFZ03642.1 diguanylate cyclase [Ramlibacter humi]
MRWPLAVRAAAWLLGLLFAFAAAAASPSRPAPVVLADGAPTIAADPLALGWLDESGTATLDDVIRSPDKLAPVQADVVHRLKPGNALWLRLRLLRSEGDHQQWLLVVANPLVDRVDVWQSDGNGGWRRQTAGDTIAVERWPEAGRYPSFRLELPGGQARDVYVQVRSALATSVPMRLATDAAHGQQQQLEYMVLGGAFGALLLLIATCAAQSWAYRDRGYTWYAVYAALSTLSVMAYTGVAAHFLWPQANAWADQAPGVTAFLAAGAAILFVRHLTGVPTRHPRLSRVSLVAGWAGLALAPAYLFVERQQALDALAVYFTLVTALNVLSAWLAWRRQDVVGGWVLLAYVPLAIGLTAAMLRLLGWLPVSTLTLYGIVAAIVVEVPMLLIALSIRTRDRHGAQIREQALSSQDALTGLLAPHLFHDRLRQVVSRHKREREDAAIAFIDLVNYARIKQHLGPTVAEQSLLRSVIKLRRLVRDVDTVARVGESRFGLIMEGIGSRAVVTDRAARLIAAGLMPLQGLKPEVTLQFHIGAVLLRDRAVEADELPLELGALLASMSPRTRRPIRFLKPEETMPAPLESESAGGPGADSELDAAPAPVPAALSRTPTPL